MQFFSSLKSLMSNFSSIVPSGRHLLMSGYLSSNFKSHPLPNQRDKVRSPVNRFPKSSKLDLMQSLPYRVRWAKFSRQTLSGSQTTLLSKDKSLSFARHDGIVLVNARSISDPSNTSFSSSYVLACFDLCCHISLKLHLTSFIDQHFFMRISINFGLSQLTFASTRLLNLNSGRSSVKIQLHFIQSNLDIFLGFVLTACRIETLSLSKF